MNSNQLYLMLVYSEAILSYMKTEYKPQIRVALDACWSFVENKNKTGKELYSLLDDGTDFKGIFIYMQLDENEDDIPSWDNLSYAIGATAREAYLLDNQQLPSPLENIDSSLIDLFIANLKEINMNFYNHLEEIKGFLKDDCPPSKNTSLQTLESLGLLEGR
ncbi:Imm6 family immunity protein [Streptococcus sp. SC1]|uniref:Imm6 family immunity protein n=1 Tax=Streptococcus TaxID=1301 RepID=UPI00255976DE|nr:Imm6 family immunity protein [Streptococcus sp. SC1]MDL2432345.1 Imm6 family immunity protein [Streptococcus sp. SC1]